VRELRRTDGVGDMSKDICVTTAMTSAAEYREYAEECLAAMRAAVIPEVRAALFVAAQRWTALADQTKEDNLSASAHGRLIRAEDASAGSPLLMNK
jgi:hypothetical protein